MKHITNILLVLLLGTLTSCLSNSVGYRDQGADPDQRLQELLDAYRCSQVGGVCTEKSKFCGFCSSTNPANHVVMDSGRIRNQIERLTLEFPRHAPTLMVNASLAFEERESVKVQHYLDRLFAIQPVHPDAAILRSRVALDAGNLPGARRMLAEQVSYTPDHAGLREAYSGVLYLAGDLEEATASIDTAQALGAPTWRVEFNRGLIAEARGDFDAAVMHYEASAEENPGFNSPRSRLAGLRAMGHGRGL